MKKTKCRHCKKPLVVHRGHYHVSAYDPETNEPAQENHYGGWVCSKECDIKECVSMSSSMPGAGYASRPSCYAEETIKRNWK